MSEEKMKILKMLEEGKITAEDAMKLLSTIEQGEENKGKGKKLRVRVTDRQTNKPKVNLTIPVGLAKVVAKFIPSKAKQKLEREGIDIDSVLSQIVSENVGKIVDVESEDEYVEISIE